MVRTRLPRGEGALLREEILQATDELLIETASEEAVSIRAVAAKVGVTAPSIYRHFEDKDALMFAVCERTFGRLTDAMQKAATGIDDPIDALVASGLEYVRFGLEHPEHYRLLMMKAHGHEDDADMQPAVVNDRLTGPMVEGSRAFNNLVDACDAILRSAERRRARRRSEASEPLPPSLWLAVEVWAMVHGMVALRIAFPTMPWPSAEEQLTGYGTGLHARFGI
jgi:AcrR family transcriptional regulator